MNSLISAVIATVIVSLVSLVGILTISINERLLKKILLLLVGLSAGALMGGAFFHLIPESSESIGIMGAGTYVMAGFALFFIIERILHWRHCHEHGGECKIHSFTYMNLIGDSIHNFIDGLIIAAAFVADYSLGLVTTVAVIVHEIPQEIGDFGVLVYGGFSKAKALIFNFMTALTAVLGAITGYFMSSYMGHISIFLIPFAAGGFIYIAASDLIPELHKEPKLSKSISSFIFFIIGIVLMYGLKLVFEG